MSEEGMDSFSIVHFIIGIDIGLGIVFIGYLLYYFYLVWDNIPGSICSRSHLRKRRKSRKG